MNLKIDSPRWIKPIYESLDFGGCVPKKGTAQITKSLKRVTRVGICRFLELCTQCVRMPLANSLCRNHPTGFSGLNSLNYKKNHATYNGYSCPLIDAGGITPWFKWYLRKPIYWPTGWNGEAVRGFQAICPVWEDNYWKSTSKSVLSSRTI